MDQVSTQPASGNNSPRFMYVCKWIVLCACIGIVTGAAAAVFLASLDWVTAFRESHVFIIAFLPLAGLLIGMLYHYKGKTVAKGNQLLLEEIHTPQKTIPIIMAPLIYISTVITHLFGGSAGREGTAIQMGGSIADQFAKRFKFVPADRRLILIAGIAAGFSAVFGTPVAGIVFGLEMVNMGRSAFKALVPSIFTAVIADAVCTQCGIQHTHYSISVVPQLSLSGILFSVLAGICFGCVARFFSFLSHRTTDLFAQTISYPPLRPFIGGVCMVIIIWSMDTTKYIGLGIPTIVGSFHYQQPAYDFFIKLLLTVFTLSAGFKGGEVTPLFFIGATLGNALSFFIPLPMGLLAGMGFIAVFAGAANAPIACIIMSVELFGAAPGGYIAVACVFASFVSGKGIYQVEKKSNGSPDKV
jgi:H+/Cl- antiporter ClcA